MNNKLSVYALSLSVGCVSAIFMFLMGLLTNFGMCGKMMEMMSSIFLGFQTGFVGSLIGAAWGFVSGVIEGCLIAIFYNMFLCKNKNDESDLLK
jgi:hypothetical protein